MASPFLISQYNAYNRFNQGAPSSKLMSYAEVLLRNPQIRRNARFLKFSWLDVKTNAVQMFNPLTSSDVKIDPSLRKAYRMAVRAIQDFTGTSSHDVRNGSMSSSLLLPFLLLLTPRLETLDLQFVRSSWWQNDLYVLKAFLTNELLGFPLQPSDKQHLCGYLRCLVLRYDGVDAVIPRWQSRNTLYILSCLPSLRELWLINAPSADLFSTASPNDNCYIEKLYIQSDSLVNGIVATFVEHCTNLKVLSVKVRGKGQQATGDAIRFSWNTANRLAKLEEFELFASFRRTPGAMNWLGSSKSLKKTVYAICLTRHD